MRLATSSSAVIALLIAAAAATTAQANAPKALPTKATDAKAQEVLSCMQGNLPQDLSVQSFTLTAIDRQGGKREMRGRLYAQRSAQQMTLNMKLKSPQHLAGAAYLVREAKARDHDEMFVFLPSVGRTRRVTGAAVQGPLLGTDFSYGELKLAYSSYQNGSASYSGLGQEQGGPVHRLRVTTTNAGVPQQIDLAVDTQSCVVLAADIRQAGQLRKQVRTPRSALVQDGDRWYAREVVMIDALKGSQSQLRTSPWNMAPQLSPALFNPRLFDCIS
jgi:hypothetical protein